MQFVENSSTFAKFTVNVFLGNLAKYNLKALAKFDQNSPMAKKLMLEKAQYYIIYYPKDN